MEPLRVKRERAPGRAGNNISNQKEKNILLSLSNDIAAVRYKKDILKLIHPKLKLLFNTDDIFICFLDEPNNTLNPVLRVGGANRIKHPDYYRMLNAKFPIPKDGFIDKILKSKKPLVLDIINFPDPSESMKLSQATGLAETLSVSLYNGGKIVGILTFWSETRGFFTLHHKKLIAEVANCISTVVVNILANEEIKKKDKQNEILLSVSNEIARIRGKEDMLHIIRNTIRKHIYFDDSFILRYDKNTKTCRSYIYHAKKGRSENPTFKNHLYFDYPVEDDSVAAPPLPVILNVESMLAEGRQEISFIKSAGIKEFVSIKLIERNQLIGFLVLLSERKRSLTHDELELLQRISYQISIATANLIANEEIASREEEKTILLSLSNEIASIETRKGLFEIVNEKFKALFSIHEFGPVPINADIKSFDGFLINGREYTKNDTSFNAISSDRYLVGDPVFSRIKDSDDPVLLDVNALAEQPNIPAYVDWWKSIGLCRVLGMALRVGGKNVAGVYLYVDNSDPFNINSTLLKGVCNQLAMKIANILAYEDIAKREEEKSILLSLSDDIASLKNRNDLFKVVNNRIKKIFSITQFGITIINEDELTHSPFMIDLGYPLTNQKDFGELTDLKYLITVKGFSSVMASDDPVLLNANQLFASGTSTYTHFWAFEKLLCLALKAGGKNIGCIFLNMDLNGLKNCNLLKGICAQLSVAVSNILANEKVLKQLTQINNYKQQLEEEKVNLNEEIETSQDRNEIIGESPKLKKVFQLVKQVAYTDTTVLLLGETGTGKELVARAVHNSSPRKSKPMVKVNCAALPANLIESELFGHERGSFTGAFERRVGKFELANNGTLFLDEIGEVSLDLQSKLLRALQEKEIERVGGKTIIKTDARIIAATNRDLARLMEEGKFRQDLYYRLNIFPITLPSLKDRREDIAELASYFIRRYSKKAGKRINTISNQALQELVEYDWPGNVRELENLIERSVLLATGEIIKEVHLPKQHTNFLTGSEENSPVIRTIDENEKEYILKILKHVNGRVGGAGGAAELLGVPTSTLNSKMKRLSIRKEHLG